MTKITAKIIAVLAVIFFPLTFVVIFVTMFCAVVYTAYEQIRDGLCDIFKAKKEN